MCLIDEELQWDWGQVYVDGFVLISFLQNQAGNDMLFRGVSPLNGLRNFSFSSFIPKSGQYMTTQPSPSSGSIWSSAGDLEVLYSGIGIYHDRGNLAVRREKHKFPDVCLKSGEPTTNKLTLNRRMLQRAAPEGMEGGEISVEFAIFEQLAGDQLNLKLPVGEAWLKANGFSATRSKKARLVVGTGLGLLFLGILLTAFSPWLGVICVVGIAICVYGFFMEGVTVKDFPFRIIQVDPQFIWLTGVNEDIARRFEPFSNASAKK